MNTQKTIEIIVDFRKYTALLLPITTVYSFCLLATTTTEDLMWEPSNTPITKMAKQRMYFLGQLKKFDLPTRMMIQFYAMIIESILTSSITMWFAAPPSETDSDCRVWCTLLRSGLATDYHPSKTQRPPGH